MSWEMIERRRNATLWQGKDAEGRRIYTVTRDRDGMASEPSSGSHRSKAAAWTDWRSRREAASAMGSARSVRKAEAVRANGAKGGRPRTCTLCRQPETALHPLGEDVLCRLPDCKHGRLHEPHCPGKWPEPCKDPVPDRGSGLCLRCGYQHAERGRNAIENFG